jgi:hypothetical protein
MAMYYLAFLDELSRSAALAGNSHIVSSRVIVPLAPSGSPTPSPNDLRSPAVTASPARGVVYKSTPLQRAFRPQFSEALASNMVNQPSPLAFLQKVSLAFRGTYY